ncbi:MAG: PEP-CTERM sorting domain-containing protein [Thiobacillus sp.]
MHVRSVTLAVALAVCAPGAWANTANVDVYGIVSMSVDQPTYGTYSAAAEVTTNLSIGGLTLPQYSNTMVSGQTAVITDISPIPASNPFVASASTTQGSNHAYAQAGTLPLGTLGAGSFSGWYDQTTITGGSGTGTLKFSVQLNGIVDAGALAGIASYGLYASNVHPALLANDLVINPPATPTDPWLLSASGVTTISSYTLGASPYSDPSALFAPVAPPPPDGLGIPALGAISPLVVDHVLLPGAGQNVSVTLTGTLEFTYGESFYLIGALGTTVVDGLGTYCAFDISGTCSTPTVDGTGTTTLNFANSANLVGIVLPQGATASFASGETYNVSSVPEPAEWLMLLAGLGLVGWRVRRRD